MKRALIVLLALAAIGGAVAWQAPAQGPVSLAGWVPAGPVLVLEAADFGALIRDWEGSREKSAWTSSANYEAFTRSWLILRLTKVRDEFAGATGAAPDMSFVNAIAGTRSVLALYNVREFEFVYITRLPQAKAIESALWKKRADYQPRESAGVAYYVRSENGRQVAFAAIDDYLLLATREDLMGRALQLMKGQRGTGGTPPVSEAAWFVSASSVANKSGDLRMSIDMAAMQGVSQFKSYWVQENVAELAPYNVVVSDLYREPLQIREERTLLRAQASDAPAALTASITQFLPANTGLYRVWASPSTNAVVAALGQKILDPGGMKAPGLGLEAPGVFLSNGETGSEADLETRIDEAPLTEPSARFDEPALRKLIDAAKARAMLVGQTVRNITGPGNVFAGTRSLVVLEANSWDAAAVRVVFGDRATVNGRFLIAGTPGTVPATPIQLGAGVVYTARFAHAQERATYTKMLHLIEQSDNRARNEDAGGRVPLFFSENIASLSAALARYNALSIEVRDTGKALQQTVVYSIGR